MSEPGQNATFTGLYSNDRFQGPLANRSFGPIPTPNPHQRVRKVSRTEAARVVGLLADADGATGTLPLPVRYASSPAATPAV